MKRWNGWGYSKIDLPVPERVAPLLASLAGPGRPRRDAALEDVLPRVPGSRLGEQAHWNLDPEVRLRHARGQSLSDWLELRFGTVGSFPDAVAFPTTTEQLARTLELAQEAEALVIPYGGGTSVVGHLTPPSTERAVLTVSLVRMNRLLHLDERDRLATFQAGVAGPDLEAALRNRGYVLGHYPQSFEFSTLGGWVVTRSSGQQSLGYGRIEDLFAGGRLISPAGELGMSNLPASAAGPDIKELLMGSEGRAGILAEATVRISPEPAVEKFLAILFPHWDGAVAAATDLARSELCLSMMRVSDPQETSLQLGMAMPAQALKLLPGGSERCLMLLAFTSSSRFTVERDRWRAWAAVRQTNGLLLPGPFGRKWREKRFQGAYLRNSLWDLGYAVDTLETCLTWSNLPAAKPQIEAAIRHALGEHGYVFSHLSHFYTSGCSLYTTYIFPLGDEAELRDQWQRAKNGASLAILAHGGTISHQHGVGLDHKPYFPAEKGPLATEAIAAGLSVFDPKKMMNPDKLL